MDFDERDYTAQGRFVVSWRPGGISGFTGDDGVVVPLLQSEGVSRWLPLDPHTALGSHSAWKCYAPSFDEAGWRKPSHASPTAIWDLRTGERKLELGGFHWGEVMGAEMLDAERLLTWGRDCLGRVWGHDGRCLNVFPLPFGSDGDVSPTISCASFGALSPETRAAYCEGRSLPAPNVELHWQAVPGAEQRLIGAFRGQGAETKGLETFDPERFGVSALAAFDDMQNAEGGYSTTKRMADGRFIVGGTTYGAVGHVYVWDGLFDLKILYPGQAGINFEIAGEVSPGVVQMSNLEKVYRFRV